MFFYFKKIEVKKLAKIPKDKPVLFLGNHQNALLDPLLIAITSGRYAYFLTRAQVFKKPIVGKLLKVLQLIPVYRVRDGWQNIANNNAIFSKCISLLNNNGVVTIFPEGNHNLKRTVRPLSKGFTRIILGTLEENPETELQLIPVGFNYNDPVNFPDKVLVNYGNPIPASNYLLSNKTEAITNLKTDVFNALTGLTTHINAKDYKETFEKLESLNLNFLQPDSVNACLASNFKNCKSSLDKNSNIFSWFFRLLLKIICCVPYLIWKQLVVPKIKENEFVSTFRFAIAITLVPLWLMLFSTLLTLLVSWSCGLLFLVLALIIALLAVKL